MLPIAHEHIGLVSVLYTYLHHVIGVASHHGSMWSCARSSVSHDTCATSAASSCLCSHAHTAADHHQTDDDGENHKDDKASNGETNYQAHVKDFGGKGVRGGEQRVEKHKIKGLQKASSRNS